MTCHMTEHMTVLVANQMPASDNSHLMFSNPSSSSEKVCLVLSPANNLFYFNFPISGLVHCKWRKRDATAAWKTGQVLPPTGDVTNRWCRLQFCRPPVLSPSDEACTNFNISSEEEERVFLFDRITSGRIEVCYCCCYCCCCCCCCCCCPDLPAAAFAAASAAAAADAETIVRLMRVAFISKLFCETIRHHWNPSSFDGLSRHPQTGHYTLMLTDCLAATADGASPAAAPAAPAAAAAAAAAAAPALSVPAAAAAPAA